MTVLISCLLILSVSVLCQFQLVGFFCGPCIFFFVCLLIFYLKLVIVNFKLWELDIFPFQQDLLFFWGVVKLHVNSFILGGGLLLYLFGRTRSVFNLGLFIFQHWHNTTLSTLPQACYLRRFSSLNNGDSRHYCWPVGVLVTLPLGCSGDFFSCLRLFLCISVVAGMLLNS